jgi:hypothetical protein
LAPVPPFDPISSPTTRSAPHREPAFVFPDQAEAARGKLFNLYLDPKETHSYLTRKLAYLEVLREGMRAHLATFHAYPPKRVMGLRAGG